MGDAGDAIVIVIAESRGDRDPTGCSAALAGQAVGPSGLESSIIVEWSQKGLNFTSPKESRKNFGSAVQSLSKNLINPFYLTKLPLQQITRSSNILVFVLSADALALLSCRGFAICLDQPYLFLPMTLLVWVSNIQGLEE